jgi:hypothetical protein
VKLALIKLRPPPNDCNEASVHLDHLIPSNISNSTTMHHKVFLAFAAAFAGGCYAKVTATEVVSSLDTITQNILDLEVQVNSISKENATDLTALQVGS